MPHRPEVLDQRRKERTKIDKWREKLQHCQNDGNIDQKSKKSTGSWDVQQVVVHERRNLENSLVAKVRQKVSGLFLGTSFVV